MNHKRVVTSGRLGDEGVREREMVIGRTYDASPSRMKHPEQGGDVQPQTGRTKKNHRSAEPEFKARIYEKAEYIEYRATRYVQKLGNGYP